MHIDHQVPQCDEGTAQQSVQTSSSCPAGCTSPCLKQPNLLARSRLTQMSELTPPLAGPSRAHTSSHLWQPALHSQHALQVEDVVPQPPVLLQALGKLQTQTLNLPHRGHECNMTHNVRLMSNECDMSREA